MSSASPSPSPSAAAASPSHPVPPCASCNKPAAPSRCKRCRLASYCNSVCQRAHWKQHKKLCKSSSVQPDEYPADTLDKLRKAFPEHTVIDASDVTMSSLLGRVPELQADPKKMLVALRRRSAAHAVPANALFQFYGLPVFSPDDPAAVVSHLSKSSAILVFHKDEYYHMCVRPLDVLVRFLRRRITDEQQPG